MISINYGREYSNDTYEYIVTFSRPMTVGEFIDEWLQNNPYEWGYFGIHDGKSIFGNPKCEYLRGALTTVPLSAEYLNAEIDEVHGGGGWYRSDFIFKIRADMRGEENEID